MGQGPGASRSYNQLAGTSIERLAGISDGIFSVGMTLLVLGLAVPALSSANTTDRELWNELAKLGPNALVYAMSFMTLGIFWVGQGTQLGQLARSNRQVLTGRAASGAAVERQLLACALLLPPSLGFADWSRGWSVYKGPDLLGDASPVRRGVETAEHGVQAEVDPL